MRHAARMNESCRTHKFDILHISIYHVKDNTMKKQITCQYTHEWVMSHKHWRHITGWRRPIGCLIFTGHFPHKGRVNCGSFAKNDLQLKANCESWSPCTHIFESRHRYIQLQCVLQHVLQCVLQHVLQCVLQHVLQCVLQHALQCVLQHVLQCVLPCVLQFDCVIWGGYD